MSEKIFSKVVGHNKVKSIFRNLEGRWPNALIFTGLKGVGKFLFAKELIKSELCKTKNSCSICSSCLRVENQQHESVLFIKPTGSIIKIESSKEILNFTSFKKNSDKRFIVINDADLLNPQASNALLKVIETPPEGTHFILISHNLNLLLPTIKSRSQIYRFGVLSEVELRSLMNTEDWIYKASGGRVDLAKNLSDKASIKLRSLALSALTQAASFEGISYPAIQKLTQEVDNKEDLKLMGMYWLQLLRDVFVLSKDSNIKEGSVLHFDLLNEIQILAKKLSAKQLQDLFSNCLKLERDLSRNIDKNLSIEQFLKPLSVAI